MKKIVAAFFLLLAIGCSNPDASEVITESQSGQVVGVSKGELLVFKLKVDASEDYFWAFSDLSGDFEVFSDSRSKGYQFLIVKAGTGGKIGLQYCQFTQSNVKVIKTLNYEVREK